MNLYEHTVRILHRPTTSAVEEYLNAMSAEGWTYAGTLDVPERDQLNLVFKRPTQQFPLSATGRFAGEQ